MGTSCEFFVRFFYKKNSYTVIFLFYNVITK